MPQKNLKHLNFKILGQGVTDIIQVLCYNK